MGTDGSSSTTRLRALLGDFESPEGGSDAAWADGFGVVAPDVQRYADVLRPLPDAVHLAMRNVSRDEGIALLDDAATALLGLLARALAPRRVLEIGTGIGFVTLALARAVPATCTLTSIAIDPLQQGRAHAFLEHDDVQCAVELRLGDPRALLARGELGAGTDDEPWDLVVLTDPSQPRQALIDLLVPRMAPDALLVVPGALQGGRVADPEATWNRQPQVELQRSLNRSVATEPRFADVVLVPVGDGLLLARRRP